MLHVYLVGPVVTNNQDLVRALCGRHAVTLVADQGQLDNHRMLDSSDILLLDAVGIRASLNLILRSLRIRRPALPVVIVDGGLSDAEKADAFSLGVVDYFPASCHAGLLAERLEVLARERVASLTE